MPAFAQRLLRNTARAVRHDFVNRVRAQTGTNAAPSTQHDDRFLWT